MKKIFTTIEVLLLIVGSFAGLILVTSGLNIVIPFEEINPYVMILIGAVILMITGAYVVKKR
ncbi:MAG: hypothetical protein KAS66_08975 [Candidatus Omnitrophica bacterium]|nr:hypothetical protein [Candidatus Omnitrophota bacterium]